MTKEKGGVVIIEDDRSVLSALERLLSREGYEVRGFDNPLTALKDLSGEKGSNYDLIVIDINLPEMDGFDASLRLKEITAFSDIPIIFISAIHTTSEEMVKGLKLGAVDYIIKPFDLDIFLRKVENFVRLKKNEERISALERRYHFLFEKYNDPTLILDEDGGVIEVNEAARSVLGIETGGGTASIFGLVHPDDRELVEALLTDIVGLDGPRPPALIRLRDVDGVYLYMEVNGGVLLNEGDRDLPPVTIHITARDVTERINLSRNLGLLYETAQRVSGTLELSEIFTILTSSIQDAVDADRVGVIYLHPEGGASIGATTKGAGRGFGVPHPIDLSNYPDYQAVIERGGALHIGDVTKSPIVLEVTEELERARVKTLLVIPVVMGKKVFGLINLVRFDEVSPFSEEEIEVLTSVADLAALAVGNARLFMETKKNEEMKSHLINVFTHEVGTPLGTIMGYTQILMEGTGDDEKGRMRLEAIYSETQRLKILMENFLDITRIRSGKLKPKREEINPHIVAAKVYGDYEKGFFEKGITPTLVLNADNRLILGDLFLIEGALTNLVSNALKYTPQGGRVMVCVEAIDVPPGGLVHRHPEVKGEATFVSFTVTDTGIGVPPDERGRIFDEFVRGANVSSDQKGAGLGLTIAREVAELHGGGIRLTTPGDSGSWSDGSRFEIIIPAKDS